MPRRAPLLRGRTVALAAGLLLAAGAASPACRRAPEVVATILNDHDVVGLDPHRVGGVFQTQTVLANLYEPLVALDREMALSPALAVSWSNPDDHTWDFELRPGVAFHTGGTLTSGDVAWSFERARSGGHSLARAALGNVRSVEVLDERRLRIHTHAPDATLVRRLRDVPVLSRQFASTAGDGALDRQSAGTGPYRLAAHERSRYVDLERFDAYWAGAPALRRARFVARSYGAADVGAQVPPGAALVFWEPPDARARQEAGSQSKRHEHPSLAVSYLGFDLRGPTTPGVVLADGTHANPFLDVRVREAAALAVDLPAFARRAFGDSAAVATQLVAPMVLGFDRALAAPRADPTRARELLAQAGFPSGFDVELDVREVMARAAAPLAEALGAVGIRARVAVRSEEDFFDRVRSGQSSLYLLRFSCRSGDAQELLDKWVHSRDDARGYGQSNYSYDVNPVPGMDEEIERVRGILKPSERLPRLQALMRQVVASRLAVPLVHESSVAYASPRLDWRPRADTFFLVREMDLAE